jgi:hypothetical protein
MKAPDNLLHIGTIRYALLGSLYNTKMNREFGFQYIHIRYVSTYVRDVKINGKFVKN